MLIYLEARGNTRLISLPPSRGNTGSRFKAARKRFISSWSAKNIITFIIGPEAITNASFEIESLHEYFRAIPKKEIFKLSGFPPTATRASK